MKDSLPVTNPDPAASETTPESAPSKPGGFGQFAERYRARWAANHPGMRAREVRDDSSSVSPLAVPGTGAESNGPLEDEENGSRTERRLP
jgi:hypothetical protein